MQFRTNIFYGVATVWMQEDIVFKLFGYGEAADIDMYFHDMWEH